MTGVSQPTDAAPPANRDRLANAHRLAFGALVVLVASFIFSVIPLKDSADNGCGSAVSPGPDSILDAQTGECIFRVSTQQGWVYPLMLVSAVVLATALAWDNRRD